MKSYYNDQFKAKLIKTLETEGEISADKLVFAEESFDPPKSG